MQAIAASNITTLKYLNLGDNKSWWTNNSKAVTDFFQFISRQPQLEELHLQKNNLSAQTVSEILFTIRSSDCLDTIKKIQLDDSSWDQDEACIQLANVIAEAPNLDMLRLLNQKGSRKINVKMQMAKG